MQKFLVADHLIVRMVKAMTPEEFIQSGQRIFGKSGWQKQLAELLERDPATINRYARGRLKIPVVIELAIRGLEGRSRV